MDPIYGPLNESLKQNNSLRFREPTCRRRLKGRSSRGSYLHRSQKFGPGAEWKKGSLVAWVVFFLGWDTTLPGTNIFAPENGWFGIRSSPFGMANFQGLCWFHGVYQVMKYYQVMWGLLHKTWFNKDSEIKEPGLLIECQDGSCVCFQRWKLHIYIYIHNEPHCIYIYIYTGSNIR